MLLSFPPLNSLHSLSMFLPPTWIAHMHAHRLKSTHPPTHPPTTEAILIHSRFAAGLKAGLKDWTQLWPGSKIQDSLKSLGCWIRARIAKFNPSIQLQNLALGDTGIETGLRDWATIRAGIQDPPQEFLGESWILNSGPHCSSILRSDFNPAMYQDFIKPDQTPQKAPQNHVWQSEILTHKPRCTQLCYTDSSVLILFVSVMTMQHRNLPHHR